MSRSRYEISELKKAVASSHRWMKKHANRSHSERPIVQEVPSEAIVLLIECFADDSESLDRLDNDAVNSIKQIDINELERVIENINDLIDGAVDPFIDMDDILSACTSV